MHVQGNQPVYKIQLLWTCGSVDNLLEASINTSIDDKIVKGLGLLDGFVLADKSTNKK